MAARVQFKSGAVQSGDHITITLDSPTTTGNALLIVWGSFFAGLSYSGSDNSGSSFGDAHVNDPSGQGAHGVMIAHNITGRSGHQVTFSFTAGSYVVIEVIEVSLLKTASAFDQAAFVEGAGSADPVTFTSGPATTTQADEYLLGYTHINNTSTLYTSSPPWTDIEAANDGTFHTVTTHDRVVAAIGSYASVWDSSSGGNPDSTIVTFKAAVGGAPVATLPFITVVDAKRIQR